MLNSTFIDLSNLSFIDLTHSLSSYIPHWSSKCGFKSTITSDHENNSNQTTFRTQQIEMSAGIGTHMDAPLHCFPHAADIASIPLTQLIAPCVVINVASKAHENYSVTIDDILAFETQHGSINTNSFVIIYTGWEKFWIHPEKYRNNLLFPTLSLSAAKLLLKRNIVGLGIDTLSPDNEKEGFPVHRLLLDAGKYIIENVANVANLPSHGASIIALPMKIEGGTEAPIRLIAVKAK